MKVRVLSLFFALTTLLPVAAQAQRIPSPENFIPSNINSGSVPSNVRLGRIIRGTITAQQPDQLAKEYGQIPCSKIKVKLQQTSPNHVIVNVPGKAPVSKFPDQYPPVTVQATGNHLGLGCKYSLEVPSTHPSPAATEQGYLLLETPDAFLMGSPVGWQNPASFPAGGAMNWQRNFVVNIQKIK